MLGLLTAVSEERTYNKEGIVTKMMLLEITDDKGKVECAVFGDYVQTVLDHLSANSMEKPIIVFQLAKIKSFRGKNVLQNVMKASRIFFNPNISDVVTFMEKITPFDLEVNKPVGQMVSGNPIVPLAEDFIEKHAGKTIAELNDSSEDGFFIVLAKVVGLLQEDQWWYFACKCHRAVSFDEGLYYCPGCCKHVMDVCARYKIKLEVVDYTASTNFMMFDADAQQILKKSCRDMLLEVKDPKSGECSPMMEQLLVGRELLFKVEKKANNFYHYDDSLRIKRICEEPNAIQTYKDAMPPHSSTLATFAAQIPAVKMNEEVEGVQCISQSSDVLSPEVLTPSLGDGPSYVGCSGNLFKRKTEEDFEKENVGSKLKMKQVKIEKE